MELKVLCDCGQKFNFDVEPVNGRMPFTVTCPACQRDGTAKANEMLQQAGVFAPIGTAPDAAPVASLKMASPPPPPMSAPPPISPEASKLRINPSTPAAEAPPLISPTPVLPGRRPMPPPTPTRETESSDEFNLGKGILGAFLGALLGAGAMYGFFVMTGFRFPLLGVGIGMLTGYGARMLYKGTDSTLGMISGGIALVSVVGTLFLMYGEFPMLSIISVIVSVSMAYRIAGS